MTAVLTREDNPYALPARGYWDPDDLDRLPEDTGYRYEVHEGELLMSPTPTARHESIIRILRRALEWSYPEGEEASYSFVRSNLTIRPFVEVGRQSAYVPDLLVTSVDVFGLDRGWIRPEEVLLVVEVVSPGSHVNDRAVKPQAYSAVGIPHFWRIETERGRPRLEVFGLEEGRYEPVHLSQDGVAVLEHPWPVQIRLADLPATRSGSEDRPA